MLQELFRIPWINRPVYGYGLMLVIGFLCAAQLAKYLARRCGFNGDTFVNAGLLALLTGVIGARLSHVLESLADPKNTEFARNGQDAWQNFLAMLNVSSGGLTYYGGFVVATPVLMWYAIRKRIPLLKGMDIIAPCLMIGLAFGRIGCYMNGCCYGEECSLPWGASFPYGSNAFVEQYEASKLKVPAELTVPSQPLNNGLPRLLTKEEIRGHKDLEALAAGVHARAVQPTELYSAFNSFLVAGILLVFFSLAPIPGRVFALLLILDGGSRYILEMVRVEPAVVWKLSFSMVLGAVFVIAGVLMWWGCGVMAKQRGERVLVAPAA